MWDLEHPPASLDLSKRYALHYTQPSLCAVELLEGRADLGLIPIAALTPELAIVPGCTIASLETVRSIQLIVKTQAKELVAERAGDDLLDTTLRSVRTISADTASRSSLAYTRVIFHRFLGMAPEFFPAAADPVAMLQQADAALLIGDPALLALEARREIEAHPGIGPCTWIDVAQEWRRRTGLPWVAAVWAVRPEALLEVNEEQLTADLTRSRDHGLMHIQDLVVEWTPRIAIPPATIRHYLTHNIHYLLDRDCIAAIELFRRYAAEAEILPPLPTLRFL